MAKETKVTPIRKTTKTKSPLVIAQDAESLLPKEPSGDFYLVQENGFLRLCDRQGRVFVGQLSCRSVPGTNAVNVGILPSGTFNKQTGEVEPFSE